MSGIISTRKPDFIMRGVIPNPSSPSQRLLEIETDVTDVFTERGLDYMTWKQKLEDILNTKDAKFARSKERLRGRGVDVKYRLTGERTEEGKIIRKRQRILSFMPYPSVFANRLSFIRQKLYRAIYDNGAIVLSSYTVGRNKHVTYFMLEEQAAQLRKATDKLNTEIDELNSDITAFEKTKDFDDIISYVGNDITTFKWSRKPPIHTTIHHISLNFTPLPISKQLIESYTDKTVMEEVQSTIRKNVEKITLNFQERMSQWVKELSGILLQKITTTEIELAKQNLNEIIKAAEGYQLGHLVGPQYRTCLSLIEAVESKDQEAIDSAAKQVAELAGTNKSGDAKTILTNAAFKMGKEVSPETKALIESML